MGVIRPRRPASQTLGTVQAAQSADTRQHRRLLSDLQIPKPLAGGGIADVAGLGTSGIVGLPWASGSFQLNFGAVTYGSAFSLRDDSSPSWLSVSGSQIAPTEEGFYMAWCLVRLVWHTQSDAPGDSLSLFINGRNAAGSPMFPVINRGSAWGVEQPVTNEPEWMTPDDYWQVEADGTAASSAAIFSSGANWRITKYA